MGGRKERGMKEMKDEWTRGRQEGREEGQREIRK